MVSRGASTGPAGATPSGGYPGAAERKDFARGPLALQALLAGATVCSAKSVFPQPGPPASSVLQFRGAVVVTPWSWADPQGRRRGPAKSACRGE